MHGYVTLSLLAMVLFGINAIVYKVAPNIDAVTLTLVSFSVSAVTTFLYWLLFVSEKQFSYAGIMWGVLGGVLSTIAFISFVKALQLGNASIVNTIRALSAAVTVILAVLVLGREDIYDKRSWNYSCHNSWSPFVFIRVLTTKPERSSVHGFASSAMWSIILTYIPLAYCS